MKIRLTILAIFTAIYISPVVYAQKNTSYLVMSYRDTLYGKIKTDVSGYDKFKIGDNDNLLSEIKRTGWNEKNLLRLTNLYNSWYLEQ